LVALTFDDGPHPRTTRHVLKVLAERGARATFFVVGRKAEQYPDVIREIHAAGHQLALHGYHHHRLYSLKTPRYVKADIVRAQAVIKSIVGVVPRYFRPPVGYVSHRTVLGARRAAVEIVAWSARGVDGLGATDPERVVRRIEPRIRDGAIILLHDAAEHDDFVPATIEALPTLLDLCQARGLCAVTVEELQAGAVGSPAVSTSSAFDRHG
jgi:peptidoglycan/xylan/chitin deacetylase (PgdA/CDA1 family)